MISVSHEGEIIGSIDHFQSHDLTARRIRSGAQHRTEIPLHVCDPRLRISSFVLPTRRISIRQVAGRLERLNSFEDLACSINWGGLYVVGRPPMPEVFRI